MKINMFNKPCTAVKINYITNSLIIMTTLFIKSLLPSLCQREDLSPSLAKRGKGRFSNLCKFNFKTLNIYKDMICFLSIIFIFSMLIGNAVSAEAVKRVIGQGPIVITSEKMTADNQAHTALFERSVVARSAGTILYADRMLVYSDKDSGEVTKSDATGAVKMIKDKRVITSQEATYYAEGEKVIFTGDPKAVKDGNVMTGKKMTYLMNEDRFLVDDSKVFLPKGEEQ